MTCPKCNAEYQQTSLTCPECGYSVLRIKKLDGKKPVLQKTIKKVDNKPGDSSMFNNLVSYLKTNHDEEYAKDLSNKVEIGGLRTFGKSQPAQFQSQVESDILVEEPHRETKLNDEKTPIQKFNLKTEPFKPDDVSPTIIATPKSPSKPPAKKPSNRFDFKKQFDNLFSGHKPNQTYDPNRTYTPPAAGIKQQSNKPPANPAQQPVKKFVVSKARISTSPIPAGPMQRQQTPYHSAPPMQGFPGQPQPQSFRPHNGQNSGQTAVNAPGKPSGPAQYAGGKHGSPQKTFTPYNIPQSSGKSGAYAILGVMVFMIIGMLGLLLMVNM